MKNPERFEGRERSTRPEPWGVKDVEYWLIMPMRQIMMGTPLLVTADNALVPTNPDQLKETFNILAFARTVLGKSNPELLAVTTWARIKAADGNADASIAEWCRLKGEGWTERTFHRRRLRACQRIAAAKNAADGR